MSPEELDRKTIFELLRSLSYWYKRFKVSSEIDHLDQALRFSDALQDYLPKALQDLSLICYTNLYELLPGTQEFTT